MGLESYTKTAVELLSKQDDEEDWDSLTPYERRFAFGEGEQHRAGGYMATNAIKQSLLAGEQLPGSLVPLANQLLREDRGGLFPRRKTLKTFRQVVELVLSKAAKNYSDACKMVGKPPSWFYSTRKKYPGLEKHLAREYYRDLEESAEQAKWEAKQKTIQAVADMTQAANDRLKGVLADDNVAPAVHVSAVKQVHDVLGVVGKRGGNERQAQKWQPSDAEKHILETMLKSMPREVDAVDAEVVDEASGRTS